MARKVTIRLLVKMRKGESPSHLGGRPLLANRQLWPRCRSCKTPMRFVAQLQLSEAFLDAGLLTLFQCENDMLCRSCQRNERETRAWVIPEGKRVKLVAPPPTVAIGGDFGKKEREAWLKVTEAQVTVRDGQHPLGAKETPLAAGFIGGQPLWRRDDETPRCCRRKMEFVVQLEESPPDTPMDFSNFAFGGEGSRYGWRSGWFDGELGSGYAFVCRKCRSAKLLSQSGPPPR